MRHTSQALGATNHDGSLTPHPHSSKSNQGAVSVLSTTCKRTDVYGSWASSKCKRHTFTAMLDQEPHMYDSMPQTTMKQVVNKLDVQCLSAAGDAAEPQVGACPDSARTASGPGGRHKQHHTLGRARAAAAPAPRKAGILAVTWLEDTTNTS